MIEKEKIPAESHLLDEAIQAQLAGVFARLQNPVVLKAIVDLSREKDLEMASFLRVIETLGDKLSLELYAPEEAAQVPELDSTYLPVTGIYLKGKNVTGSASEECACPADDYGRVAFCGIPGGKELNSFVLAIYNLSGPGQELAGGLRKKIEKLKKPVDIKICVSLACHHCPQVVVSCQRIAMLNSNVTAEMIDAALYPDLVEKYHIERVPIIIINENDIYPGHKTMEEIVYLLKK